MLATRPSPARFARWFTTRAALGVATGFLGLTAVAGGIGILLGRMGLSDEDLAGSPFDSYLIPGLALLIVVGGAALLATLALLRRHPLAAPAAVVAGSTIVVFEVVQATVIGLHPLQVFYAALGLLIIALAVRLGAGHVSRR
jgi:hypothetical protein